MSLGLLYINNHKKKDPGCLKLIIYTPQWTIHSPTPTVFHSKSTGFLINCILYSQLCNWSHSITEVLLESHSDFPLMRLRLIKKNKKWSLNVPGCHSTLVDKNVNNVPATKMTHVLQIKETHSWHEPIQCHLNLLP